MLTVTCSCSLYPLTFHFYIIKLAFTQMCFSFAQDIVVGACCTHNQFSEHKYEKIAVFHLNVVNFDIPKNHSMLHRHVNKIGY